MSEVEIERMVVRLNGDGSSYQKMLKDAGQQTQQTASIVGKAANDVDGFGHKLTRMAESVVASLELFGVERFLHRAFDMFAEHETMQLRLRASIEGNGRAADEAMVRYEAFAKVLKETKGVGKDASLELLREAETLGMWGDTAELAVKNAINLGAALGQDAHQFIMVTQAMATGNSHMLGRIRQLRGLHSDEEKFAKVQQLIAQGERQSATVMNSTEGVMRRYSGAWKAITKQFGEYVNDAVKPAIVWTTKLLETFTKLDDGTKRVITGTALVAAALLSVGPALAMINSWAVPLFNMMVHGLTVVKGAALLLLNPVALIKAAWLPIGALFAAVGWWLVPIAAGIATVVTVIGTWISRVGGLANAWGITKDVILKTYESVKAGAVTAWNWVQDKITAFATWAKPYLAAYAQHVLLQWTIIKTVAVAVWDFVKPKITAFVDWVSPYVTAALDGIAEGWDWVKTTASDAWDWIKAKSAAFWEWIQPIVGAGIGAITAGWDFVVETYTTMWEMTKSGAAAGWDVMITMWEAGVAGITLWWETVSEVAAVVFGDVWEIVSSTWESIFGTTDVTWDNIQQTIVESMIVAEFALRNFKQVADWASAGVALGMATAWNEISFTFTDRIPTLLAGFIITWQDGWTNAGRYATTVVSNLVQNMARIFSRSRDLIRGNVSFSELWRPLGEGFQAQIRDLPAMGEREIGAVEAQLIREFNQLGDALGQNFVDFRERRLREIGQFRLQVPAAEFDLPGAAIVDRAMALGQQAGSGFASAAKKEVEKFDAALAGSAEAMHRIAAFRDKMERTNRSVNVGGQAPPVNAVPALAPAANVPAGAPAQQQLAPVIATMHADLVKLAELLAFGNAQREVVKTAVVVIAAKEPIEVEEVDA